MAPSTGILYVQMTLGQTVTTAEYNDWYNNEHGPLRMRLPFIKTGSRFRASDSIQPEWLTMYDSIDMEGFNRDEYLSLGREPIQTQRERDLKPNLTIDRRAFDLLRSTEASVSDSMAGIEGDKEGGLLLSVSLEIQSAQDVDYVDDWYSRGPTALLSKIPGWRRSRTFITSKIDNPKLWEFVALHEFQPEHGLSEEERAIILGSGWENAVASKLRTAPKTRMFNRIYNFGPAPRDLLNFRDAGMIPWSLAALKTKTIPSKNGSPVIEATIPVSQNVELLYRLEGSTGHKAPVIVISESDSDRWVRWDDFVQQVLVSCPQYRVVRFAKQVKNGKVVQPTGAADFHALLDALRVETAGYAISTISGTLSRFDHCITLGADVDVTKELVDRVSTSGY